MSKFKAIIAVPTLVEFEYANNLKAAALGAATALKEFKEVEGYRAKLLELRGPNSEIEPWAEQKKAETRQRLNIMIETPPPFDDGPPEPTAA